MALTYLRFRRETTRRHSSALVEKGKENWGISPKLVLLNDISAGSEEEQTVKTVLPLSLSQV
jgi:hypothetical protein